MGRINDKIEEIEGYLQELSEIMPLDFEGYLSDKAKKAACERYFEKIIGAIIDLAFIAIKDRNLEMPEEDKKAFDILRGEQVITDSLAERLSDAKGMRNILAHEYGELNDELVYNSVKEEIIRDAEEFIRQIEKFLQDKK